MEAKKTSAESFNWLQLIRDLVIVNIGVALFFLLLDMFPLWILALPIIIGFFIPLCLSRERRLKRAFTLFFITWLIFALIAALHNEVNDLFTFLLTGIFILLLMLSGLGFSYFVSQPGDVNDDQPLTWKTIRRPLSWKGVGLISFLSVMIILLGLPSGHPPNYNGMARSALKNLATIQEEYYIQNDAYALDLEQLSTIMPLGDVLDKNVEITILRADKENWAATASHKKSKEVFTYTSEQGILGSN